MMITNVSQKNAYGLPEALRTAQDAIHFPEVQEMLRRLSEYRLGICMPHMHNEETGGFQPLPETVMQVESGLEVSFQPSDEIVNKTEQFLPVAWFWRRGAATVAAGCEMVRQEGSGDTEPTVKHKMPKGN